MQLRIYRKARIAPAPLCNIRFFINDYRNKKYRTGVALMRISLFMLVWGNLNPTG